MRSAPAARTRESEDMVTFPDGRDGARYRRVLHHLRDGQIKRLAFVRPAGASWPLALYDLALMTANEGSTHERAELSLITPEETPLGIFGKPVSDAIRRLLLEGKVSLHTSSYGAPGRPGWLAISPGKRRLPGDRVITLPRLSGPRPRGIPCAPDGFIQTDLHGRLAALDGVFAAGDATAFPVKQGGVAAQQAEAVAQAIAASVGADIDPQPFRPILHGALLTGAVTHHLHADISGRAGDDSVLAGEALRWPPGDLNDRHLGHHLRTYIDDAGSDIPLADQATRRHHARLHEASPHPHDGRARTELRVSFSTPRAHARARLAGDGGRALRSSEP